LGVIVDDARAHRDWLAGSTTFAEDVAANAEHH
jgi:hypothetical protein